jgi:MFS family permease
MNVRTATYRLERIRAIASGVLESADQTFIMLIAVQALAADNTAKGVIAGGSRVGMLLAPLIVLLAARVGKPSSRIAASLLVCSGIGYALPVFIPSLLVYVPFVTVGAALASMLTPFTTQIYQSNYPAHERGKLFSRTNAIKIIAAIGFGELAGRVLSYDLNLYPLVLALIAGMALLSAGCLWRVSSQPVASSSAVSPLQGFRFLRSDRTFLVLQISWMMLGLAWFMVIPLRVDYLSSPKYGIQLGPREVALFVSIIPDATRLLLSPLWGWVFDKLSFFTLRIITIFAFSLSMASFFLGGDWLSLAFSAVAIGFGASGGDLAWNLWATKLAPPEHLSEYMGVHVFLTGIRGVFVPFFAFQIANGLPLSLIGIIGAAIMAVSGILLIPEYFAWRKRQAALGPS